jgi:hypothetical protein
MAKHRKGTKRSKSATHRGENFTTRKGSAHYIVGGHELRPYRRKSKRKSKKRKVSKLQRAHLAFMKKKLKTLNKRGGKPTTNMKKAAKAWKKSPQRRKALGKSRRKKHSKKHSKKRKKRRKKR